MGYWFSHVLFKPLRRLARVFLNFTGGFEVKGLENVPKDGAYILASNHLSYSDPVMLLGALPRPVYYMAAKELFDIPVFGKVISFLQAFPVERGKQDLRALVTCQKLLQSGEAVVIYPEGRICQGEGVGKLQAGAALLAIKSKVPIVPVFIVGSDKFLPLGDKWIHFTRKEVRFGKPIYFEEKASKEYIEHSTEELHRAMTELGKK
ncbi:1-acyl-sn-glycerol-3-phosphate acyltransferase [bacterium]|nr:1-acyl-sn-glycerol-3-phosphate acyltransferase [bacterium]